MGFSMPMERLSQRRQAARLDPASPDMAPIRQVEIEIGRPLAALTARDPATGRIYGRVLALIRLHGRPLGFVEFETQRHDVSAAACARRIWDALHAEIGEHLRDDGLDTPDQLTENGLPLAPSVTPACERAYTDFLASAPPITVVIPTHNRPDRIRTCLDALLATDYPCYQIIVVDNAPESTTTAHLIRTEFEYLSHLHYAVENRRGAAHARNHGLAKAQTELVAFIDDDVRVDSRWLTEIARGFSATDRVACVTGGLLPTELDTPAQQLMQQSFFSPISRQFTRRIFDLGAHRPADPLFPYAAGQLGTGANMAFRASVLRALGGFDPVLGGEQMLGGEDLDLLVRVVLSGHRLVHQPSAIVRHAHYRDYDVLRRQVRGYGIGLSAFLLKCILDDPRRLALFLRNARHGVTRVVSARSPKNASKKQGYPKELTRSEMTGMLIGPFVYLKARWRAWRQRHTTPAQTLSNPATMPVASEMTGTARGDRG